MSIENPLCGAPRIHGELSLQPRLTERLIRCARRPDESDAREQEWDPLPVLYLAVIVRLVDKSQRGWPTDSGSDRLGEPVAYATNDKRLKGDCNRDRVRIHVSRLVARTQMLGISGQSSES
jgi:hypothetical protein